MFSYGFTFWVRLTSFFNKTHIFDVFLKKKHSLFLGNNTECLKIDATHWYDSDLLLRQAQWLSFGTCPVKNASFELETSNECFFNCCYINFQDTQSFFEFLVSVTNHFHINGLHLFWDSFEWFCFQISSDANYFCPGLSSPRISSCYRAFGLITGPLV